MSEGNGQAVLVRKAEVSDEKLITRTNARCEQMGKREGKNLDDALDQGADYLTLKKRHRKEWKVWATKNLKDSYANVCKYMKLAKLRDAVLEEREKSTGRLFGITAAIKALTKRGLWKKKAKANASPTPPDDISDGETGGPEKPPKKEVKDIPTDGPGDGKEKWELSLYPKAEKKQLALSLLTKVAQRFKQDKGTTICLLIINAAKNMGVYDGNS